MPSGLLYHRVPVNVWEETQTEPVALAGVREAVHGDAWLAGVEGLAHPGVELVVGDAAPEGGLAVHYGLGLQPRRRRRGGGGGSAELSYNMFSCFYRVAMTANLWMTPENTFESWDMMETFPRITELGEKSVFWTQWTKKSAESSNTISFKPFHLTLVVWYVWWLLVLTITADVAAWGAHPVPIVRDVARGRGLGHGEAWRHGAWAAWGAGHHRHHRALLARHHPGHWLIQAGELR